MEATTLNFEHLDDLLTASVRKGLDCSHYLAALHIGRIGPLVELLVHHRSKPVGFDALPNVPVVTALLRAVSQEGATIGAHLAAPGNSFVGFLLTSRDPDVEDETEWAAFCLKAQQAAEMAGIERRTARGLVGALREIEGNVHEHSGRSHDGIVGYRSSSGEFEFVVADNGVGALESLRQNPKFADLVDAGRALELALTDGVSKFTEDGRGYGFRELFIGLANLNGELRFRSGDHALTINGVGPVLPSRQLIQKPEMRGFVASIVCRP